MQKTPEDFVTAPIAAAGSMPRRKAIVEPSHQRRAWLAVELAVIFVGAPFLMQHAVYEWGVPVFAALPPVLLGMIIYLLLDRTFSVGRELKPALRWRDLGSVLVIFAAGAAVITWYVSEYMPQRFLALPRERPDTWIKILCLYPFTSVLAQEFVYRSFFFHRYGPLFGRHVWLLLIVNAAAFGLGHLMFRNGIAVWGTMTVGLLFGWRYYATRSFWTVWFEHVLWGWLVFTVGLGVYFFTGVRNPAW